VTDLNTTLALEVQHIIMQSGMSQATVAEKVGIGQVPLSYMLTGKTKFSAYYAELIARECGYEIVIYSRPREVR
jgi:predicted XRE-type DNA-binding protein